MRDVLSVHQLTKIFKGAWSFSKRRREDPVVAVDHVSFTLGKGEIVGLLGPNGAGKTTTAQMLLGTLTPTSGEIRYFGTDFASHRSEILYRVNFASAYTRMPWRMSVYENLKIFATLYRVPNADGRIKRLLKEFGVEEMADHTFGSLSAGQKTRAMLAKAFLNYPEVMLLDEPTASLDPDIALEVRRFLSHQQREYQVAMVFTSHNMAEVEEVCDRVIFLSKGKIVAEDTPAGLAQSIKQCRLLLTIDDGLKRTQAVLKEMKLTVTLTGKNAEILVDEKRVAECLNALASKQVTYSQISIEKPTLEDYFVAQSQKEQL